MSESPDLFCSHMSRAVGEQLFGTCVRVDLWLLLEYNQPWGAQAFEESNLPDTAKDWLSHQLETIPNSRLHFIKQRSVLETDDIVFYVASAHETHPAMFRFHLDSYDELTTLDMSAILAGELTKATDEKLLLVCTNGRRDRCCALYGTSVYNALRAAALGEGVSIWQTTHSGGHRFAATMLCFPHGLSYGRLDVEDVPTVVDSYRKGVLLPDKYRGRSCYDAPVQAADYYLRVETGRVGLADFRLVDVNNPSANEFAVTFESTGGERYRVHVAAEPSEWYSYTSCVGKSPGRATQYRLIQCEPT